MQEVGYNRTERRISVMKRGKAALAAGCMAWICMLIIGLSLAYGNQAGEILKATPEQFDFGTVPEGTPAATTTTIQNIGNTPVEITNVRTS
jgi:hypothetical protein